MKIIFPKPIIYIERWKYSNLYGMYVSNLGRFKDKQKKLIKPKVDGKGYLTIQLKYGIEYAHRIVAAVWLPEEDMYHLTVDHLDHNKRNNAAYNLQWVTKEENLKREKNDLLNKVTSCGAVKIKMFVDESLQGCKEEFNDYPSAAKYIKENFCINDPHQTEETIIKFLMGISNCKKKYFNRWWVVER